MEKIKITSDSTCDLTKEIIEANGIGICPIAILLGMDEYHDTVDVDAEKVLAYVNETGVLPKTAATPIDTYKEFFSQYTKEGYTVIHFNISSKSSSCNNNANMAAKEMDNVYVIDSLSLSSGQGIQILKAVDLIKEGKTAKEVVEIINEERKNVQISFVVDKLDFLHKGGRCSSVANVASKVLKIHPSIAMKDGALGVDKKYMGSLARSCAQYVKDIADTYKNYDEARCFITHSPTDEAIVNVVKEKVAEYFKFNEVIESFAGSTVTSHCGYNTIGIIFYLK
ncbi:MAG: DegV family protein [Clostridiales bacterium]|nr:DegV family protein [Clostridiales bacterium]